MRRSGRINTSQGVRHIRKAKTPRGHGARSTRSGKTVAAKGPGPPPRRTPPPASPGGRGRRWWYDVESLTAGLAIIMRRSGLKNTCRGGRRKKAPGRPELGECDRGDQVPAQTRTSQRRRAAGSDLVQDNYVNRCKTRSRAPQRLFLKPGGILTGAKGPWQGCFRNSRLCQVPRPSRLRRPSSPHSRSCLSCRLAL
jgi:hypothetical protein